MLLLEAGQKQGQSVTPKQKQKQKQNYRSNLWR
jgi:hypothetical protein